jgi:hypothetical protein
MSNLSTLPNGDSDWLLRKAIERIIQQISVLETNIGSSTTGNSANTQIIFNDNGVLRGDADLLWNSTLNLLTVTGSANITADLTVDGGTLKVDSTNNFVGINKAPTVALDVSGAATITGALTVDTTTLKVDATNHRVGIGTASPLGPFHVVASAAGFSDVGYFENSQAAAANVGPRASLLGVGSVAMATVESGWNGAANTDAYLTIRTRGSGAVTERYRIASDGVATWSNVGGVAGPAMTLNSTGLGVGGSVTTFGYNKGMTLVDSTSAAIGVVSGANGFSVGITSSGGPILTAANSQSMSFVTGGSTRFTLDASGILLVGTVTSPTGTKVVAITKLSGVSVEGTAYTSVSTTPVAIARSIGTGGLFFVAGFNTSGGAQGWWLVASTGASVPTVIASGNNTLLTVAFTQVSGVLNMNTVSGTIAVNSFAVTN